MSDLEIFLSILCFISMFFNQFFICKNDSLNERLYILKKENKFLEERLYKGD